MIRMIAALLAILLSKVSFADDMDLTTGIRGFKCSHDQQDIKVPIVLLRDGEVWSAGDPDIRVKQTSENAFSFSKNDTESMFLTLSDANKWQLTAFDGAKIYNLVCEDQSEFVSGLAKVIATKVSKNVATLETQQIENKELISKLELEIKKLTVQNKTVLHANKLLKDKLSNSVPINVPEEIIYWEFPGAITTNLKNSRRFLQVSLGLTTHYGERVTSNCEKHLNVLKAKVLKLLSNHTEDQVVGREARAKLAEDLLSTLNKGLEELEGFGGIKEVMFTSYVMQ